MQKITVKAFIPESIDATIQVVFTSPKVRTQKKSRNTIVESKRTLLSPNEPKTLWDHSL